MEDKYMNYTFGRTVKVLILLTLLVIVGACGTQSNKQTKEAEQVSTIDEEVYIFEGTTALPQDVLESQPFFMFQERIEKKSNGRIRIEYKGGPESIPGDEAGEAVRSGAITFSVLPSAYHASSGPEVLALSYSEIETSTELER